MRFEVSERIRSKRSQAELLTFLEDQFKKISEQVQLAGQTIEAKSIEASFGSINRNDTTIVSLKKADDGWLVIADVHYRPSVAFWIILVITLFTWVFWLVPIIFYLLQKNTVRNAITECFQRVKNEFDQPGIGSTQMGNSAFSDLEKLAALKEKGHITDSEYEAKKKQLLGLA
ncbi:MAG: SHOCT domain-containing protein [Smithella sp.]